MVLHWMPDSIFATVSLDESKTRREVDGEKPTESLLPQRNLFQVLEPILLCRAVNNCVLEEVAIRGMMVHSRLDSLPSVAGQGLQLPRVASLVVYETGIVVAFVEILQHGREYFWLFIRQRDAARRAARAVDKVAVQGGLEEWGDAEDIFMGGEETLFLADDEGDNGRCERA
jgi:hypothetical protein